MNDSDDRLAKPARDSNSRSPQDPLRLLDDLEITRRTIERVRL